MSRFRLVCAGCGTPAPPLDVDPYPFRCRCAASAPDTDHVISKGVVGDLPTWPTASAESNPFVRYRRLLYSHDVLLDRALSGSNPIDADRDFVRLVERLDESVFRVCDQRFRITPFARHEALGAALGFSDAGGVWVKDETGNVSGSHKGRHLAGIMLYLQLVRDEFQFLPLPPSRPEWQELKFVPNQLPDLAIASCGNAALAAAVVARAAGWPLRTFVPTDANASVIRQLRDLGATIVVCPRKPGEVGDPCYLRFQEALAGGALPFCCQGPDNGLTIEGGETVAYEMADQVGGTTLDAIVIQVGGGALASACVQGFERAVSLGRLRRMPRIYTAQTEGGAPLARAFTRVAARVAQHGIAGALRYAATHRSEFMWPWETAPHSVAHGILDDEAYDWLAVVKGMLETGGRPVVVDEHALEAANRQGRDTTGIDVDHTGSAGLAGLVSLRASADIGPDEHAAVIFSGVRRA